MVRCEVLRIAAKTTGLTGLGQAVICRPFCDALQRTPFGRRSASVGSSGLGPKWKNSPTFGTDLPLPCRNALMNSNTIESMFASIASRGVSFVAIAVDDVD